MYWFTVCCFYTCVYAWLYSVMFLHTCLFTHAFVYPVHYDAAEAAKIGEFTALFQRHGLADRVMVPEVVEELSTADVMVRGGALWGTGKRADSPASQLNGERSRPGLTNIIISTF